MKILFFSDAHGNHYTVTKLVHQIKKDNIDLVIFGGDIFGYYYGQKKIISLLRDLNCICLKGNHDHYFLELYNGNKKIEDLVSRYGSSYRDCLNNLDDDDLSFIRNLKTRYEVDIEGLHLFFVHGSLDNNLEGRIYPDTEILNYEEYNGIDYVFYGHTHHKLVKYLKNGTILVNPGSIGQQRDGKGCSYVIFDTVSKEIKFYNIDYDVDSLVNDIKRHNEDSVLENKLIEVLYRNNSR